MKLIKNFLVSLITVTMMLSGFTSGVFAVNNNSFKVYNGAEDLDDLSIEDYNTRDTLSFDASTKESTTSIENNKIHLFL